MGLLSKLPQIWSNFRQGHTGQLSAFTVFMYFAGTLARVFTTIQEVQDPLILWGFLLATLFNGVLALQMVVYWNKTSTSASSASKLKQGTTTATTKQDTPAAERKSRPKKD